MDLLVILGWILIVLGVVFILFSLLDLAGRLPAPKTTQAGLSAAEGGPLEKIIDFIKAIGTFIEQLTKAPRWLCLFILGALLLVAGVWLVLGHPGVGAAQQARLLIMTAEAT